MQEHEKAYLAGFLDADGCITIRRYKRDKRRRKNYYNGVVYLINRDRNVLEWAFDKCKSGNLSIGQKPQNTKWCQTWKLVWSGRTGYELLKQIRPYLHTKSKQADLYIELYELKHNHMTQLEYSEKEKRYEELKVLCAAYNKKGPEYLLNNGVNSGKPKEKSMAILSQAAGTPAEGAETTGEVESS